MSEWQPIETAPKDGTRVDLWMVDHNGYGRRVVDAFFSYDDDYDKSRFGRIKRFGWKTPYSDYGDEGWCDEPKFYVEQTKKWVWDLPTHWMPLPEPPEAK